jgi:excisionase family DNA binding protein
MASLPECEYDSLVERAARLGVHPETVRRSIRAGKEPGAIRVGARTWRIKLDKQPEKSENN